MGGIKNVSGADSPSDPPEPRTTLGRLLAVLTTNPRLIIGGPAGLIWGLRLIFGGDTLRGAFLSALGVGLLVVLLVSLRRPARGKRE